MHVLLVYHRVKRGRLPDPGSGDPSTDIAYVRLFNFLLNPPELTFFPASVIKHLNPPSNRNGRQPRETDSPNRRGGR